MGPPLIAAENPRVLRDVVGRRTSFDGAAADRGGEPGAPTTARPAQGASMGPPLIAAENRPRRVVGAARSYGPGRER